MILTRSFYYLVSVLSLTAAQTPSSTCTAKVSVESSAPGHAAFMYTDIYVENTGSCPITKVITSITLPPMEQAFDYKNVSGETGELFGISFPLLPSNTELGGTIVLRSARLPMVELGSVECEASCMGNTESTSTRSVRTSPPMPTTTKVEIEWGSNPRWLALSLIDDVDTSEVWIVDSKNSRQLMKRENWDIKTAYTFSPNVNPLELPLSVELKSNNGEVIVLKDLITSFSYAVIDTQAAFSSTPLTPTDYSLRLVAHPSSNSHWIGLAMYGTQTDKVTTISVKASNTDYAPMELTSVGFFSISSPNLALRTPISARITFEDGHVLNMDNVVMF